MRQHTVTIFARDLNVRTFHFYNARVALRAFRWASRLNTRVTLTSSVVR